MAVSEKEQIAEWVATWGKAACSLEEIRRKELRAADYYERNKDLTNDMLQYAFEHRVIRLSSGLVDQQRLFIQFSKKSSLPAEHDQTRYSVSHERTV